MATIKEHIFQPGAYSTKAKKLVEIRNEIFQKVYNNIKSLPDYSELSFDSKTEVIKELREDIDFLSHAFSTVTG